MKDETIYCDHCEEPLGDDHFEDIDTGRDYCDLTCKAADEQDRAEAAHEAYLSRFYGGEIVTQEEQYRKAWEDKRKM
jgi:hypothetical protein